MSISAAARRANIEPTEVWSIYAYIAKALARFADAPESQAILSRLSSNDEDIGTPAIKAALASAFARPIDGALAWTFFQIARRLEILAAHTSCYPDGFTPEEWREALTRAAAALHARSDVKDEGFSEASAFLVEHFEHLWD